jgi:hypothetical protein
MYLGFGVAFLVAPAPMAELVHLSVEHPVARTEVRAFYGGLEMGLGVFLLLCLVRRGAARLGALALALLAGGTAVGRVFGIIADGSAGTAVLVILVVEATFALLGTVVYIREGRDSKESAT